MATRPIPPGPQAAAPFDQRLSTRIDCILIHWDASTPRTIGRAWWRLLKAIAESQVPAVYPDGRRA